MTIANSIRPAIVFLGLYTVTTGVLYPLLVTGIAQVAFPNRANGSVLQVAGQNVGSSLIGQNFGEGRYFWGRPSATSRLPYDALASTGSNLGPSNPALAAAVRERVAKLRLAHPDQAALRVPVDLVTSSGSGLDPHISPAAADFQVTRVARVRGLDEDRVRALVEDHVEGRTFMVFGEPRVNVLRLNLALDELNSTGPEL